MVISKRGASIDILVATISLLIACCVVNLGASSFPALHSISGCSNSILLPVNNTFFFSDSSISDKNFSEDRTLSLAPSMINETASSPVTLSHLSISPSSGDTNTQFTFTVLYIDSNNNPPYNGVILEIDGEPNSMSKQNLDDYNYSDGCIYTFSTMLSSGSHWYYASCQDESYYLVTTNTLPITVNSATTFSDPGPILAIILISLGIFISILIPAVAQKIRVKKPAMTMFASTSHLPPSMSNTVPVSGILPRSAFVEHPLQASTTTSSVPPPPAIRATPVTTPPIDIILPGTPKWARLARFDISQYMMHEGTEDFPTSDAEQTGNENIQDGIRISQPDREAAIKPEMRSEAAGFTEPSTMEAVPMNDEATIKRPMSVFAENEALFSQQDTKQTRVEGNILYIGRAELERNTPAELSAPISLSCSECGTRVPSSEMNENLVYFCKNCQKAMVLEISCSKCFGKTTIKQDEKTMLHTRASRCPVCFEVLL